MKKKLALLMAAIMTVAMVPVTALAATKSYVVNFPSVGEDGKFTSTVELKLDNPVNIVEATGYWFEGDTADYTGGDAVANKLARPTFQVKLTLANGEFSVHDDDEDDYLADDIYKAYKEDTTDATAKAAWIAEVERTGVVDFFIQNKTTALLTFDAITFNQDTDMDVYNVDTAALTGYSDDDIIAAASKVETGTPLTAGTDTFQKAIVVDIQGTGVTAGEDVVATFERFGGSRFTKATVNVAEVVASKITVESEGMTIFVEDSTRVKTMKDLTIKGLRNNVIKDNPITLKLSGNYTFRTTTTGAQAAGYAINHNATPAYLGLLDVDGNIIPVKDLLNTLNYLYGEGTVKVSVEDDDEIRIEATNVDPNEVIDIILSKITLVADKKASAGDVAKIRVSSKDFDSVTLEVAKMVEEAVTYTVEDDELPVIWAGKDYGEGTITKKPSKDPDDVNTLKVSVEENTGDILNTSRKATFTFPDGIEVVGFKIKNAPVINGGNNSQIFVADEGTGTLSGKTVPAYEIDENVLTLWNYQKKANLVDESDHEKGMTDFDIEFVLNAAPTFTGDVEVTLGGEFDDVTLKVATVKLPYTVEAKTTEVLIDYRYVPVNEIVITEAKEGLLEEDDVILLAVEKMDFEDAGSYEVTSGDIEVSVNVGDYPNEMNYVMSNDFRNNSMLYVTVDDESTEASTIVISGLELYLDRTLPVGGYTLFDVGGEVADTDRNNDRNTILWENSSDVKSEYDLHGIFKYKDFVCNDNYVEVVTQARDQDDYTTNRKIVLTIGAATMAVGTETITLDTPAYINSENYTQLPLRAVSEAFGATVNWDDASRTVTIMMGQRVVSMTIGSKTMYVNGTPVAMNTAPEITNSRTFVPVRDLANALGITKIDWNEASATVTLN